MKKFAREVVLRRHISLGNFALWIAQLVFSIKMHACKIARGFLIVMNCEIIIYDRENFCFFYQ